MNATTGTAAPMDGPLSGIRILEVASHVFVPIGGGVLAEWGAEVIKIEHPVTGDPYRGLVTAGLHKTHNGVDPSFQFTNRGKHSVTIDLKKPEGRDLGLSPRRQVRCSFSPISAPMRAGG